MKPSTAGRAGLAALAAVVCTLAIWTADAQTPGAGRVRLRYAFQPDCLRASLDAVCDTPRATKRLDFGAQIAVWVEKPDGSFIDTLLVTNATAVWGIGNRPGYWRFPSNWRFPYGKRTMVLPVWAHARGKIYDSLVMQDDDGTNNKEMWLGFGSDYRGEVGVEASTPLEQAYPLVFLCSDAAAAITGITMISDAGYMSSGITGSFPEATAIANMLLNR